MKRQGKTPFGEPIWKNEPGEPQIQGPGDWLAMMVQSEKSDSPAETHEEPDDTRAAEGLPPRKAIISIDGQDVEERDISAPPRKRRVA